MRNSIFEFFGFAAILGMSAALILLVQQYLGIPEVVQALTQFNPWVGANTQILSWAASGVVLLTAVVIPVILMFKDSNDGGSRLGALGLAAWVALLIPGLGYLLYVGWLGAKYLLGQ